MNVVQVYEPCIATLVGWLILGHQSTASWSSSSVDQLGYLTRYEMLLLMVIIMMLIEVMRKQVSHV